MPSKILITKEQCLYGMSKTNSVRSCARFLSVSYQHLKKYLKLYVDEETGQTLFEIQVNKSGKGISKFLSDAANRRTKKIKGELRIDDLKHTPLTDLLSGKVIPVNYSATRIKDRLIKELYLKDKCYHCGFNDHRLIDNKAPLILNFKDCNKKNWALENLEILCYNCYFIYVGNVFSNKQLEKMEDYLPKQITNDVVWELDEYNLKRLDELGLNINEKPNLESGEEFISRI